nr:MAG TPA: hypothetical protein [Caudoviricetes sp.]
MKTTVLHNISLVGVGRGVEQNVNKGWGVKRKRTYLTGYAFLLSNKEIKCNNKFLTLKIVKNHSKK